MHRGSTKEERSRLVAVRLPMDLDNALQRAIRAEDSDFSKFIRNAIRERLARHGFPPGDWFKPPQKNA